MVAVAARGPARSRRPHRRHRQRPGRRPLQRLLHARADDGDRAEGDAARAPLERRVRARASRRWRSGRATTCRFPGAAFRQLVELLVRRERADERVDPRRAAARSTSSGARGDVLVAMAERDNVVPAGGHRARAERWSGDPARREALRLPGRPRHVRDRQVGVQAHDAAPDRMDHGPQRRTPRRRGGMMEIRRIEPGDRAALERFLDEHSRGGPHLPEGGRRRPGRRRRLGAARRRALDRARRTARSSATSPSIPLHGWSSHVGEVRIVVDPDHRGRGVGQALARHAVLEALELGLRQAGRRGDRRPGGADRDVPRARLRARGAADRPRPRPVGRAARPARARPLGRGAVGVDGRGGHRRRAAECNRRMPSSSTSSTAARQLVETALGPWGGAAACIDAYEAAIRSAADAQVERRAGGPPAARPLDRRPVRRPDARHRRGPGLRARAGSSTYERRVGDGHGARRAHGLHWESTGDGRPGAADHGPRAERRRVVADRAGARRAACA